MILTDEQSTIALKVESWLKTVDGTIATHSQYRYLAGPAGTGKTSLARSLGEGRRIAYCAFTGKAAHVLREKGCADATTLHKLIYRPVEKTTEATYTTEFVARDDDPLADFDLVVLDECGMISTAMAQDLLFYGKPVLVLGDPFQLPPVKGEGFFTSREPDWTLTEVHRQAAESGILRLATDIREGRGIGNPSSYGPECAVISLDEATEREDELLRWCDVVLVGTHRMRRHFNDRYRAAKNFLGPYPEVGDQLVCLQNDHRRGLLNGGLWQCETDAEQNGWMSLELLVRSLDGDVRSVDGTTPTRLLAECWAHDFLGTDDDFSTMPWKRRAEKARFAYGYALTVHKSQGSEYDRVLLVDESSTFREHAMNWLYTGVTRASKQLIVVQR